METLGTKAGAACGDSAGVPAAFSLIIHMFIFIRIYWVRSASGLTTVIFALYLVWINLDLEDGF